MRTKERLPRKCYFPEFKLELVRLALEQEGSIAALARQHDVNDNLLFKWIRLWQREGRVCRPRKNASSLPALTNGLMKNLTQKMALYQTVGQHA
ncbi:transposase [Salmonella enterica]|nr:transposase [Salmonella enterica]HAU2969632.1 transposase [Salmonella enterica subsp. diarizonae]